MVFVGGWVSNGMLKHVTIRYSIAQGGQSASTIFLVPDAGRAGKANHGKPSSVGRPSNIQKFLCLYEGLLTPLAVNSRMTYETEDLSGY